MDASARLDAAFKRQQYNFGGSSAPKSMSPAIANAGAQEAYKGKAKRKDLPGGFDYIRSESTRDIAVFYNGMTGETLIAFRGTDLSSRSKRGGDLWNDALIAAGLEDFGPRVSAASKYVKEYLADKNDVARGRVTLTGHSLGATVAHHIAHHTGLSAIDFNVGESPIWGNAPVKSETQYRDAFDPVSSGSFVATAAGRRRKYKGRVKYRKGFKLNPHSARWFS
jgi:hypothetical protein